MILMNMILGKFRGHSVLIGNQEFNENDTGKSSRCIRESDALITPISGIAR